MKAKRALIACLYSHTLFAGPYIEVGIGVPLLPESGYIPDSYGIAAFGYKHHIDETLTFDVAAVHRSLTGSDYCNNDNCYGDNAIETKFILEWK